MTTQPDTHPGAFLQLIDYRTDHPEAMDRIVQRWVAAIGTHRTARWYITTADRDRPGTYLQLVEFPNHDAAALNSDHPATAAFAAELRAACTDDIVFRNLDVINYVDLDTLSTERTVP